jgi:hypothetical protein
LAKLIPLSNSDLCATVDDEDFEFLSQWEWRLAHNGYAISGRGTIRMHRAVMKPKPRQQVDHINGDRIDNRRTNLRLATRQANARNRPRNAVRNHGARYKGIFRCTETQRWRARIEAPSGRINLGTHATQEDAAKAYDRAALKHWGVFARLNFPDEHVLPAYLKAQPSAQIPIVERLRLGKRKAPPGDESESDSQ